MSPSVIAVVPAAGKGERFGELIPKALFEISGKSIIARVTETIAGISEILKIIILYPGGYKEKFEREVSVFSEKVLLAEGGITRQDSLRIGLELIQESKLLTDQDIVVVHDAARCFASPVIFRNAIQAAIKYGAVSCAIPVVDSLVCESPKTVIGQYLDRSKHWLIQTPQAFQYLILKQAHLRAFELGEINHTDDASLLYKDNPVRIIEGEQSNIKVTYKKDLSLLDFASR